MLKDKSMRKFIWIFLGVASIFIPGPIIPIISFLICFSLLIYEIKRAKESPEGFEALMVDLVILIIVIIIDVGCLAMRISIEKEYNKFNYSSSSKQTVDINEVVETAIYTYEIRNLSQFSSKGNHLSEIKTGFLSYLKDDLGISDTTLNGNKITCNFGKDIVVFTITKNDIKYTIK